MGNEISRRAFITRVGLAAAFFTSSEILTTLVIGEGTSKRKSEYDTIGHTFLDMESSLGTTADDYAVLDGIIDKAKTRIKLKNNYSNDEAIDALKTIDDILRVDGFHYKENRLLNKGLKTKEIDCDNYSILYISIGEALNLPLSGVSAPEHMFVRWEDKSDSVKINWETTNGSQTSIEHLIRKDKIPIESIQKGVYFESLNRNQLLAFENSAIANELNNKEEWKLAWKYYDQACELDSKSYSAFFNRGLMNLIMNRNEEAISDFNYAYSLRPKSFKLLKLRAESYQKLKNYDAAIADYTEAIETHGKNDKIYLERGKVLKIQGRLDEAIDDFYEAVFCKYENVEAWMELGTSRLEQKNYENALFNFEKVIELDSTNSEGYFYRGKTHLEMNNNEDALNDFEYVIKLDPDNYQAYQEIGKYWAKKGDFDKALKYLSKARDVSEHVADSLKNLLSR